MQTTLHNDQGTVFHRSIKPPASLTFQKKQHCHLYPLLLLQFLSNKQAMRTNQFPAHSDKKEHIPHTGRIFKKFNHNDTSANNAYSGMFISSVENTMVISRNVSSRDFVKFNSFCPFSKIVPCTKSRKHKTQQEAGRRSWCQNPPW